MNLDKTNDEVVYYFGDKYETLPHNAQSPN